MWEKPLSDGSLAVAVMNLQDVGGPQKFPIVVIPGWKICDPQCNVTQILPQYKEMGTQMQQSDIALSVNPTGTTLLTITPIKGNFRRDHKLFWKNESVKRDQTNTL